MVAMWRLFKKRRAGSYRERHHGGQELHAVHASLFDKLQTCAAMNNPLANVNKNN
jgi:hypothetical protein